MQRYVSELLTHFVGRNLLEDQNAQYQLLVKILKSGWLLSSSKIEIRQEDLLREATKHIVRYALDLSTIDLNNAFIPDVVCFADIPLADLKVHMQKYSLFGISFKKDFLIKKGASPVFYISSESTDPTEKNTSLEMIFRKELQNYLDYTRDFEKTLSPSRPHTSREESVIKFHMFLQKRILCSLKFWKASTNDSDAENFYLEREWRLYGGVNFALDDIQRIVLPGVFSRSLRADLPQYNNEVVFSDGSI